MELFAAAKTVVFCTKKVGPLLTFERGEEEGTNRGGILHLKTRLKLPKIMGAQAILLSKSSSSVPALLVVLHRYLNDFVNWRCRRCSRW